MPILSSSRRSPTNCSSDQPKQPSQEGVIQFISCHELGSTRIFTLFVVRDGNDHSETQSKIHFYPRMGAASGAQRPEAAV